MRYNTYEVVDTLDYSANTTKSIDLPRSGYITHIDCLLEASVSAGASASAAEDGITRLIKAARIKASGAKNFFDVTDGRQWEYIARLFYQNQLHKDSLPEASSSGTVRMQLPIHLGTNPFDLFDRTVVIPARELSNLVLEVEWGAASDLGTDYTVSSATMYVTVHEVALEPGESVEDVWPEGLVSPRMEPNQLTLKQASNLGFEHDAPVGDTLFWAFLMATTSAGARSNDVIDEVGVKLPKLRETPYRERWEQFVYKARRQYSLSSDLTGVGMLPLSWISGEPYGLDLTAAMVGDVKLGFTVPSGGANGILHIVYMCIG